jgi:glutamyl-tRNA(Gln) amidotransferase subunit D
MTAKPGDFVEIKTKDEIFEGILMPRPDLLDKEITVLKLDSGYNIGIDNSKIVRIQVIKPFEANVIQKQELKHNDKLPTVSILSFGGTISSKIDYRTGGVSADYTAEDFVKLCPEIQDHANIRARKVMGVMSEDLGPDEWKVMAKEVARELNDKEVDGVVVTQGTDTLHFSSAAMSFFLGELNKPVIFTASQRSIDRGSSDAFMNLVCAIIGAAKFDGAEVMTCLHGSSDDEDCLLIRGTKVRKMHTSRRDAFRPINELPFAKINTSGTIHNFNSNYRKRKESNVKVETSWEDKVALIQVHPAMDPDVLDFYLDKGVKGIVLSATALGHVPTTNEKYSLMPKLQKAMKMKVPIVIASQTIYGRTHPFVYSNLRALSIGQNCIFAEDMLPEVAYMKLSWILGQEKEYSKVKEMMLKNYAGEINPILDAESFLY